MSTFRPNSSREQLINSAPSIRSSRAASVFSEASTETLIADTRQEHGYRGYASKEAYLKALREWVDNKMYFESDVQLQGWYGTKTKEDYLNKTSVFEERKARKAEEKERRATLARVPEEGDGEAVKKPARESKLRRVFGRRNTVV